MLRQSRSRPITPNRQSNNSIGSNISNNEAKKFDEKLAERRSSSSATRSTIGLKHNHWSKELKEVTVVTQQDGVFNFRIVGGSDHGEFPVVVEVMPPDTRGVEYHSEGELTTQDVLLEIQGQKVAGYTQADVIAWTNHCSRNSNPVVLRTAPQGSITSDLRQYLNTRFPKGGVDHDLQNTIRDNLYLRTVPVTTRTPRPEERHGVDYTFLSKDEFLALEKSGDLLESGVYDGNHYGTPKPSPDSPTRTDTVIPGAHPSSEGKRRRNRSNVEAMAAKHNNLEQENERELSTNGVSPDNASGSSGKSISENNADSGHPDSPDDDGLGPLPPNWEKAYTDKGEPYFIDHNSGTSHWLDPRLSRIQKQRPEDCDEGELPFGWERIDDPHYGTYYIDHVNRRTQYENPVLVAKAANQSADDRPFFTRDPTQLKGEKLQAKLVKSTKGLGFTIVGGDDSEEEFLQIKSVVPNGPAWLDGKLKTGDVLVYVNGTCVLGFTHHDMVTMFQGIGPGEVVSLDVCRGYPLPFDPDDPNTEIVTTVAVTSPEQGEWANELERQRSTSADADTANSMPDLWRGQPQEERINNQNRPGSADLLMSEHKLENGIHNGTDTNSEISDMRFNPQDLVTIPIVKGGMGFGFTIADSAYGQKVKKILDRPRCKNLNEGDILVEINNLSVRNMSHGEVVQVLKDCARGQEAAITIQRGILSSPSKNKFKKNKEEGNMRPKSGFLFRSKTPTAELFATQEKEIVPMRPKTPIVDTRNMSQKNWNSDTPTSSPFTRNDLTRASLGGNMRQQELSSRQDVANNVHDRSTDQLSEQFSGVNISEARTNRSHSPGRELDYNYDPNYPGYNNYNYNQNQQNYNQYAGYNGYVPSGYDPGYGYSGYNEGYNNRGVPQMGYSPGNNSNGYRSGSLPRGRKESTSFEQSEPVPTNIRWPRPERRPWEDMVEITVTLLRHDSGFGFRIVGGTEEGSQVSIGHIVPGGAADLDGRLFSGDEIVAVDGQSVLGASHHVVVGMMGHAAQRGQVALTVRRRQPQEGYREGYPYDVTVSRLENEGFGFVIISSVSRAGSTIGRIIPGSPAERCGRLQVGDRILAVNHVDINSLHHGDIVNLIKESGYSVTLTVGPPIDDTSSTASTSHREDQEVNSHLAEEEQYFAVELQRGQRGFGFSIRGGREFHSMPLFVLRMAVDGPATQDGRLRVGDQLIEINSQSTKNMTHGEAIELIKNGGMTVRLLVRRGKAPNSAFLDQAGLSPTSPTPVSVGRPVSSLSQPGPTQPSGPLGPGPVSHSSPRYPPQYNMPSGGQVPVSQYNGGYQQPQHQGQYWGYQQAVE